MSRDIPTKTDDVVDSRAIIERIEELEGERESAGESAYDGVRAEELDEDAAEERDLEEEADAAREAAYKEWDATDEGEELKELKALAEQCEGYGDWAHGETLIRGTYFEQYAEQTAEDIGAIKSDASWPNNCIDWSKAADELKADYMAVDWGGEEYYLRA